MIKAREIRIGNLVDLFGSIATVVPSDFNEEHINKWIKIINGEFVFKNWNPISLTEEWLKKLGFTATYDAVTESHPWHDYQKQGILIQLPYFEFIYSCGDKTIEIKYVHQLQNLYYALSGEELEVKS